MFLRGPLLTALRLFMACLVALWPALCCCSFNHVGSAGPGSLVNAESNGHQGEGAGCCDKSPDRGAHRDGPRDGCGCLKSSTTLASPDAPQMDSASPVLAIAWLPLTALQGVEPARRESCGVPRIERPPPIPLVRLRVLRI